MMKFQGKQTVNNLLVSTVLIAGASFAIFYLPMMGTGLLIETANRPYDYFFHYRADQKVPTENEIKTIAKRNNEKIKDWVSGDYITLALDGRRQVEEENSRAFHYEYAALKQQGKFISESSFEKITGQSLDVKPGTYLGINNEEETALYVLEENASKLTNMVSRQEWNVTYGGTLHYGLLLDEIGYYVLDNKDYQEFSEGLTDVWKGKMFLFNADGEDHYAFATELFHTFVASFDKDCETINAYDPVAKIAANEKGEPYWLDINEDALPISFSAPDSTDFRQSWTYMPIIRILDQNDFLQSFAVFLMMFLFIAIICIIAAMVISYTRCQAITLNNRYIFDDLRRLGASPEFLAREVRNQCRSVFQLPAIIGMTIMYFLYCMIMYANDGKMTFEEIAGLGICLVVLGAIALIIYGVYRKTTQSLKKQLGIQDYSSISLPAFQKGQEKNC